MRLLLRRIEQLALFNSQVLVRLGDLVTLHELTPDRQELVGDLVTFVVIEKNAVALEFDRITACHDADKQSPVRQAVKRGRCARGKGRFCEARPHRDKEAQSAGERDHCRGDDPRVLARPARWKQHTVITEVIGGPGDLREIAERNVACADFTAQVSPVAVRWQKPEDVGFLSGRRQIELIGHSFVSHSAASSARPWATRSRYRAPTWVSGKRGPPPKSFSRNVPGA